MQEIPLTLTTVVIDNLLQLYPFGTIETLVQFRLQSHYLVLLTIFVMVVATLYGVNIYKG